MVIQINITAHDRARNLMQGRPVWAGLDWRVRPESPDLKQ